ncbi:MAG: F0F1 ATP synthase subunit B [Eubacterium sp.]|nr:F0F1 ATP synthase subunit B [Eubacterium sp.]
MLKFDWNFLIMLFNLVIFFVLMKVFLFKPITRVMEKRKEMINKQFQEADEANAQAQELKKQYEDKIENINDESQRIIGEAKENARVEASKIIERAEGDADKLLDEAKKQAIVERENEMRAARENIAELAMEAAAKVVGANVSDKTNSDIFDEFLNESSDGNESEN